jgi:hypothetical protein
MINMAGYVKGSDAWLKFITDQIITAGDLLARQKELNLSEDEVKAICDKHDQHVWRLCNYIKQLDQESKN